MGPVEGKRTDEHCSVNFVRLDSKEFYKSELSEDSLKIAEGGCMKNKERATKVEIREEICIGTARTAMED